MSAGVLAVMDSMAELARDVAHLEADAYLELTDDRLEELDARYGNVPRAAKMQQALLRFTQSQADAIEARATVAELILAGSEYVRLETEYWSDDASPNELRRQYEDAKARFEDALARAAGGQS